MTDDSTGTLTCCITECGASYRSPRAKSPYCPNCSQRIKHWSRRDTSDVLEYQSALRKRSDRMLQIPSQSEGRFRFTNGKVIQMRPFVKAVRRG